MSVALKSTIADTDVTNPNSALCLLRVSLIITPNSFHFSLHTL